MTDGITLNGGQLVVRALENQAIKRVFCVPGESYLPVLDALHDSPIDTIVCRHESGAAMMAEATGKLEGRPGICFVTRGPGATNACSGLHVALQDSTPMILFIGQIGTHNREREAFQEVDYRRFLGTSVKWVAEIDHAERIDEFVSRAFHTATSGRPGPVALALPEDTLSAKPGNPANQPAPWKQVETHPCPDDMRQLVQRICKAERPIAILGGSRWDAESIKLFQQLAIRYQLPVACSFRRQMLFDHLHPHYAGDVGIGINPALEQYIHDSDLVLLLGGRMSEMPSQDYTLLEIPCTRQSLVHVYPGAEELGRLYQPELAIHASPASFVKALQQLTPSLGINASRHKAVKERRACYEHWSSTASNMAGDRIEQGMPAGVNMRRVIDTLQSSLPDNAIITNGAGNYASWIHRFWRFRQHGSQLAPTSGSMGYGLPAGIAAKLNYPQRCVVAFAGDGCLQMSVQELATAMQYHVNLIIIVVDNCSYGTIRMHQEKNFPGRISGTDLYNPDFAALAEAYGAMGFSVDKFEQFPIALRKALAAEVTALIHIKTSIEAITPTMTLSGIRNTSMMSTDTRQEAEVSSKSDENRNS